MAEDGLPVPEPTAALSTSRSTPSASPRDAPCTTAPIEHRPFKLQRTRPFPPSGGRRRQHTAPADDGTASAFVASIPPADARPVLSTDGGSADARADSIACSRVGCVNSAMTHLLIQGDAGPRSPLLARYVTAPATRNTHPPISGSKRADKPERAVAGVEWYDQTYSWRYSRWPRFPQSFRCRI